MAVGRQLVAVRIIVRIAKSQSYSRSLGSLVGTNESFGVVQESSEAKW
jgi:hypothetical protein